MISARLEAIFFSHVDSFLFRYEVSQQSTELRGVRCFLLYLVTLREEFKFFSGIFSNSVRVHLLTKNNLRELNFLLKTSKKKHGSTCSKFAKLADKATLKFKISSANLS